MDFFEVLISRHSYRGKFTMESVPRADLHRIVQAGIDSPTAHNRQTSEYVIIDDPAKVKALASVVGGEHFITAGAVILCSINKDRVPEGYPFAVHNLSASVATMLLTAVALGYASVWTDDPLSDEAKRTFVIGLFGLGKNCAPEVLLPIGRPMKPGRKPQRPAWDESARYA